MTTLAPAYLDAAVSAANLLADTAVASTWDEPSALSGFTVRGLAGHLGGQVLSVAEVLDGRAEPGVETLTLEQHYGRVLWRGADVDATINVEIREGGEDQARAGHTTLVTKVRASIDGLRTTLANVDGQQHVVLPWTGWALTVDDFLTARMLEIAIHSDDLAVSVGIPTPDLPARVLHPVFDVLFVLSLRRHGHTAMLRALSRAERAPASIAAL